MSQRKWIGPKLILSITTVCCFMWLVSCSQQFEPKATVAAKASAKPMNILMIAVDDLNHWARHLNRNSQTISPNIDALAAKGMSFHRAYAPAAICNATRSALMMGLRPSTSGVYQNGRDWRSVMASGQSLPAYFKANGYKVMGGGKIFHNDKVVRLEEWDYYYYQSKHPKKYQLSAQEQATTERIGAKHNNSYIVGKLPIAQLAGGDDVVGDYHVARWAADELAKEHDKPFFMAVGIFRPHLPWEVPKKYFDLYPEESLNLPPYKEDDLEDLPNNVQAAEEHTIILKDGTWKKAIQAYLASITYADVQIGRVLDALEKSPYKDNTMIVLWGDHGWHLGEKHRWRKFALWEEATRTPYIWYVPGLTKPGSQTSTPVDLQSLWPTLSQLSGLAKPDFVEGHSIAPLLHNPEFNWTVPALTTHGFGNHAIRWQEYRYIQYRNKTEELYDHTNDPYEWYNQATNSNYIEQKQQMQRWLPTINRQWDEAAKLFGGDPAYSEFKKSHAVTKNEK